MGDLYETFIGASIRGSEGQFFTPENAGRWLVDAIAPSAGERIINPACGAGGFLLWAAQSVFGGSRGSPYIYGIEKDEYLASLARARMAIRGVDATVHCGNSLSFEADGDALVTADLLESFDVVVTNPPFGKNINSVTPIVQRTFQLGYSWQPKKDGRYARTESLSNKAPPQVLFLERILSFCGQEGARVSLFPKA